MNKVKIQMAGIRSIDDALMCAEYGVDIIGLLVGQVHYSDDFISKDLAKMIKQSLPHDIKTTLITHLDNATEIIDLAKYIDVDYIQLHSNIEESKVQNIKNNLPDKKLIRLIHIANDGNILTNINDIKIADFYITDSINMHTNQVGGTGLMHNLDTDRELVRSLDKPVFIAGGLTPDNVANVIKKCNPFGVDVNSGCRAIDGTRDREKVAQFVKNAHNS